MFMRACLSQERPVRTLSSIASTVGKQIQVPATYLPGKDHSVDREWSRMLAKGCYGPTRNDGSSVGLRSPASKFGQLAT